MKQEENNEFLLEKTPINEGADQPPLSTITYLVLAFKKKGQTPLKLVLVLTLFCILVSPYPIIAMWFGFALASYSVIANDSIQTIGTFIASNAHRKWWHLWIFMAVIFLGTVTYSWVLYDGDVSFQRLAGKGFSEAPTSFNILQLFTPVALLMLTRLRIPVSTTFLLLNVFATDADAVVSILQKSLYGYFIAFFLAIIVWCSTTRLMDRHFRKKPGPGWTGFQWITSGLLWSVWLMQDASNVAIFLPRSLDALSFLMFVGFIFLGLGVLFYLRGDRMQQLVSEKEGMSDIRAAALVDLVFMGILFYFKNLNSLPMSTTWTFIGLLAGRELAISLVREGFTIHGIALKKSLKFIGRDLMNATIGLVISVALAMIASPVMREKMQALVTEVTARPK